MELYTRILLPKARFSFSYEDRVVMMGSCFAENIGRKLEENKSVSYTHLRAHETG